MAVVLAAAASLFRDPGVQHWFRLAAGRSILTHGFPRSETWSLAGLGESPWLTEWLFNVALFGLHRIGGDLAIALARAALAAAAMGLAIALLRALRSWTWTAALLLPLVLAVARDRFRAWPDAVLPVLILFALVRFERARAGLEPDRTRWLVPLQALGTNLHGAWILGPAIAWLYASVEWLGRLRAPRPEETGPGGRFRRARLWSALGLALIAASALHPAPLATVTLPLRFLVESGLDEMSGALAELRPWTWPEDLLTPFTWLAAVAVLAAAIGGRRAWRVSPGLVLVALGALALGFQFQRFRGLAALVALGPAAIALSSPAAGWRRGLRLAPAAAAALAGLGWLVAAPGVVPGIAPARLAAAPRAVALADSAGLAGPTLNSSRLGGYILWGRGDDHPPLTDYRGRGGPEFRILYRTAHGDAAALDSLLETRRFTNAILSHPSDEDGLATELSARLEWAMISYDDDACLYVRWNRHEELVERLAYRYLSQNEAVMTDRTVSAVRDTGLGSRLVAELERARRESPARARACRWLATLAIQRGDGAAAVRYVEEARRIAPRMPGLAIQEGLAWDLAGDRAKSVAAYRRALKIPEDAEEAKLILESLD